ncbi:MAG: glycosyltransferase family 2 protein [Suilimivivens sp.]
MNIKQESKRTISTTVVIPNYNGMRYIGDCLDSVLAGSSVPEVVVVDNGSTDGSCEFIREKYPRIRLLALEENTGFSHAVNVGIEEADTKYVFLLNNDTVLDKKCVEELERAMENADGCFSVGAKMINMRFPEKIDDAGDFYCALGWAYARGKDREASKYGKSGRIFSACAGAALYRKELFETVGLFDEAHFAYLEDIDIGYRANISGYRNEFAPKAIVYHAGSGVSGSRHNPFKVDLTARNSIYLIYKNMPVLQVILNLPFLLAGYLVKFLFFSKKGMGKVYLKGIGKGFRLSFSKEGKERKIRFQIKNFPHYLWIQWQLWINTVRRII